MLSLFVAPQLCRAQQGRPAVTGNGFLGASGGQFGQETAGWYFTANSPITVTSLGVWDFYRNGLASPHEVGLWDASGNLLAEAMVPAGTTTSTMINDFNYVTIPSVSLQAGHEYCVAAYYTSDQQEWVYNATGYNGTFDSTITWQGAAYVWTAGLTMPPSGASGTGQFGGSFLIGSTPTPDWAVNGNGNWSASANWSGTPPNATDAVALLGNVTTAPRTVTCDVNATLGNLTLGSSNGYTVTGGGTLTMQVSSGDASMTVTKGSHLISAPVRLVSNTDISVLNSSDALAFSGPLSAASGVVVAKLGQGAVAINAGATVNLPTLNVSMGTVTLAAGAAGSIGSVTVGASATLTPSPALIDNGALIGTLNVSGGQVLTGAGAKLSALNLIGGSLNTQGNSLAITGSLTMATADVTFRRLGGGPSFGVQGGNLVTTAATIDLSGVTLQATLPSATGTGLDIGEPFIAGSDTYNLQTETYTVAGGGIDANNHDQLHFVYMPVSGNLDARCKLLTQGGSTDNFQKAGIMMRNSTDATSAYQFLAMMETNQYGTATWYRNGDGGSTGENGSDTAATLPAQGRWLRLVRNGNTFTAYTELDGDTSWTQIGQPYTPSTPMNNTYLVGLAVTSNDVSQLLTDTFSNVNFLSATAGMNLPSTNFVASSSGTLNVDFALTSTLGNVDLQGTGTIFSLAGVSGKTSFNNLSAEAGSTATLANAPGNSTPIALRGTVTVTSSATLNVTAPIVNGDAAITALAKSGNGTLVLGGSDSYSGATTISGGVLAAGAAHALSPSSAFTVSGGTLDTSAFTNAVASLSVGASGCLSLGLGNTLSSRGAATLSGTLNVFGTGTLGDYPLITYTSKTGSFAAAAGLDPNYGLLYNSNGKELDALHKAQVGTLTVSAVNPAVITGGKTNLIVNLANSAPSLSDALSFTASASGTGFGFSAAGDVAASSTGSATIANGFNGSALAPGSYSGTVIVTGTNNNLAGAALNGGASQTVAVTVLDHSNASLSSTASQMTQTLNFGNVLRGANVPSQSFTIYNLAANTSGAYTANLKLTGFTPSGDPALQTNLAPFGGLTANNGSNGNTFTASLNTSDYTTTGINTVTMSAAQLADDSTLPGAGGNNNGAVTVTLQGNVGNATADNSNSQAAFGPALTAAVAPNASYASLESKTTTTSGSGGQGLAGSTATIVAGTNSSGSAQTVSMAWRTQTQGEIGSGVISDIVQLSGIALNGSSGQTAPFVVQMSYDSDVLPGTSAADDPLYLAWLDPLSGLWVNAVDGNVGTSSGNFEVGTYPSGDTTVGDWGVNTANQTVWAVVNHDGDFAVVPEPGTLVLLGVGALSLLDYRMRLRRRRAARTSVPCENGTQATLSFPSRLPEATRRAA
jgi:autotransporter-associated beta strand protein